jgi:hypothetical protein
VLLNFTHDNLIFKSKFICITKWTIKKITCESKHISILNLKRYLLYYVKKILTYENITALINLKLLLSSDHTLWNAVAQYVGYILKIQSTACEAATQTCCPLVEQCTTKKLAINIETANINCPSKNCEHNAHACKRNYSTMYRRVYGFHRIQVCEKNTLTPSTTNEYWKYDP